MEIRWYQLLFQVVNFGVLIFLLNRFLYRPILKVIELRNKKIEDSIKTAEETLKEKEKIAVLKQQALSEAEKEAVQILEAAKQLADKAGKRIISTAQSEAEQAVDKKLALLTDTLAQEEKRLRGRIGDLVVTTTRQVLKTSLTNQEQKRIVDQQIKDLRKLS